MSVLTPTCNSREYYAKKSHIQTLLISNTENGEDIIKTDTNGACLIEETGIMLRYPEQENQGNATLLLTDGLADLKRHGHTQSRMTFIEGKLLPCHYNTPHGNIDLNIYTHQAFFTINADGGRFEARYTLLVAGKQVADNVLTIEWSFT